MLFHWTQKAITTFPISLLGEGKTVPVPPVRFCTRFQRFTVPTVHRLFDFLRFGSTVPVRFQKLTVCHRDSQHSSKSVGNVQAMNETLASKGEDEPPPADEEGFSTVAPLRIHRITTIS